MLLVDVALERTTGAAGGAGTGVTTVGVVVVVVLEVWTTAGSTVPLGSSPVEEET